MKTLHIFSKGLNENVFDRFLSAIDSSDDILFIENGVLCLLENTDFCHKLKPLLNDVRIFALEPDVRARGLDKRLILETVLVDYHGFVKLSEENERAISWY